MRGGGFAGKILRHLVLVIYMKLGGNFNRRSTGLARER